MRPEPYRPSFPEHHAETSLDRLWAATRPTEPSAATMNALWAQAACALDAIEGASRPGTLKPARRVRSRRRQRVFAGIALAQAAVVLLGVGIAWTRRASDPAQAPALARQVPPGSPVAPAGRGSMPTRPMVVVGVDQTLVVRIGDNGHHVDLLADPSALPSLSEGTPVDVFNALESMAAL